MLEGQLRRLRWGWNGTGNGDGDEGDGSWKEGGLFDGVVAKVLTGVMAEWMEGRADGRKVISGNDARLRI